MNLLKKYPLFIRFLLFILMPLVFYVLYSINHLYRSLPQHEGAVYLDGLNKTVRIVTDSKGVPSITTEDEQDVYFAMGYLHAQDRLWQLELQRRIAAGRLSEIIGAVTVGQDSWMRTLGFYPAARESWKGLSAPAQQSLSAYAKGVNAWIAEADVLPPEFLLLDFKPEPWSEIDSLAWFKVFALGQSQSFHRKALRYVAKQYLSEQQMGLLLNSYPKDAPTTVVDVAVDEQATLTNIIETNNDIIKLLHVGGDYVGSNAWVVAGKHSANGQPILANDPHMGLQIPSLWYVANVDSPTFKTSGMTIVGLPTIVFGQNGYIAWGGTNMVADAQDLYVHQVNNNQPNQYFYEGELRDFTIHEEVIEIARDFPKALREPVDAVTINVRRSHFGPVITQYVDQVQRPISLRWPALSAEDTSYETLYQLSFARNWQQFQSAASHFVAPTINLLYSDRQGNIGYTGIGRIPLRAKGDGVYPVPGWTSEYEWQGFIPFEKMPKSFNPAKGYIVSANNKVVGDDYPFHISHDWASPARAKRIEQLLDIKVSKGHMIDVEYVQHMQADVIDLEFKALKQYLEAILPEKLKYPAVRTLLGNWDGEMSVDNAAAAVYYTWVKNLRQRLLNDELQKYSRLGSQNTILANIIAQVSPKQLYNILTHGSGELCEDISTPNVHETCKMIAQDSLNSALYELGKLQGNEVSDWRWGNVHHTVYKHVPFSQVNLLDKFFERRVESMGSENSVNVSSTVYSESDGFEQVFGAAFRQIIQFNKEDTITHRYMNSTGQSGNPFSEHYSDMVEPFSQVRYLDIAGKHNDQPDTQPQKLQKLIPLADKSVEAGKG